ncbi:MAG: NAD/NADP octopine/nopaline dehydrogenase family protein [Thermodesulfobacteriota bacterium]
MSSTPNLTVCGAGNAGAAIAADCTLAGLNVTLFELPKLQESIQPFIDKGGIQVTQNSDTSCGKTGFAKLAAATVDPEEALADSDVIMITVPAMYHSVFWDALEPHMKEGQIVMFNTGYFSSLRHSAKRNKLTQKVTLAESNIMPYICAKDGDTVHIARHKRSFRVAAFPGNEIDHVYGIVRKIYPQYEKVDNVLDTNIASGGNPAFHPTLTIPIAGFYFDRYQGGKFYSDTTVMGGRLIEAYDRERKILSQHLESRNFQTITEFEKKSYEYFGKDIVEMLRKSEHIDWYASDAYLKQLIDEDLIYAYVPMVLMAEQLGIQLPVTRSMVEILGIMLREDYWSSGITLDQLGIAGMNKNELLKYVTEGKV